MGKSSDSEWVGEGAGGGDAFTGTGGFAFAGATGCG